MSVSFTAAPKVNPQKPKALPRYYAIAQSNGEVNFRTMAKEIAEITTVSLPDAIAVLESLLMIIPRHIERGEIVRLGELGSLRLTIRSEGSDTEEECNTSKIKQAKYCFTPGQELQQTLKTLKYSKIKKAATSVVPE
jgi:predicted histone-like DNA-binding protein